MDVEERFDLVTRGADEVITESELRALLQKVGRPRAYVGLEPSGMVHVGLIILARKLQDLQRAGFHTILLLADWHAYINDKMGGAMESIRVCGEYFRDCFYALGVDRDALEVLYASDLVDSSEYWRKVIDVSKSASIARIKRALTIMGRKEEEADADASMLIYPAMQVADILHMDIDLALGGIDQRHAHMLLRDIAGKMGRDKVVALHTPLLGSLLGKGRMDAAEGKMSKSRPETSVLLTDTPDEISRKVRGAYCPPKVEGNPVLGLWRLILLPALGKTHISRSPEHRGDLEVESYDGLEAAYASGDLHPADLKEATTERLVEVLAPVRAYFEAHPANLAQVNAILEG